MRQTELQLIFSRWNDEKNNITKSNDKRNSIIEKMN